MMCHSVLLVRHLLTQPGAPRASVRPVRITGHIASLKWSRPAYAAKLAAAFGKEVDYGKRPSEDFANLMVEFETPDGQVLIGEASTSWSFVGAGLRLSAELLGPEYSMSWNTLDSGLNLFFSREVRGSAGADLVEKQNAEVGARPVVASEAAAYGYESEDRHFARVFLGKEAPRLTFEDGFEVVQLLMAAYMSAEQGKTLDFPPPGLESFSPAGARCEGKSDEEEHGRKDLVARCSMVGGLSGRRKRRGGRGRRRMAAFVRRKDARYLSGLALGGHARGLACRRWRAHQRRQCR